MTVCVTGMGAFTPLGADLTSTWDALLAGKNGVAPLTADWVDGLPTRFGAQAPDPTLQLEPQLARRLDRSQQFAWVAAREAWHDADEPDVDPERLAVVVGSGVGGLGTLVAQQEKLEAGGVRAMSPNTVSMMIANTAAGYVSIMLGAKAGAFCPVSACATGGEAIVQAADLIRLGKADVVVCGGTEASLTRLSLGAFSAVRALSRRNDDPEHASRPFDVDRDGFVMGEGAGILVLESENHARARGARIRARILGGAVTSDANHPVAPHPDGEGAARAVTLALRDAGIEASDVGHVNAHATSTPAGDVAEVRGLRTALGAHLDRIPVSATKSATGHLIGAAGAVEATFACLAVAGCLAPPTLNLERQDPAVDIDVPTQPRILRRGAAAVSTSFGFGGHNVALVVAF